MFSTAFEVTKFFTSRLSFSFSVARKLASSSARDGTGERQPELSAGLVVEPAQATGSRSTMEESLRGTSSVESAFDVQARDRFGNRLGRPLADARASFGVSLNGTGLAGGGLCGWSIKLSRKAAMSLTERCLLVSPLVSKSMSSRNVSVRQRHHDLSST